MRQGASAWGCCGGAAGQCKTITNWGDLVPCCIDALLPMQATNLLTALSNSFFT